MIIRARQVVNVTCLTAHFERAMNDFLLELRCNRRMTAETLVVLRGGRGNGFGGGDVGRRLLGSRADRQEEGDQGYGSHSSHLYDKGSRFLP